MSKINLMPQVDMKVVIWIREYLFNRSQRVKVDGAFSDELIVNSGVPQGSVLGPLLFLVYINDIAQSIRCSIRLYADDIIIYQPIKTVYDCTLLQDSINAACEWVLRNNMKLNIKKTQCITFKNNPSGTIEFSYSIQNQQLSKTNSCTYLGVICNSRLSWTEHINSIASRANRNLHFVMRNLKKGTVAARERAYFTIIRPLLEYCSSIWSPHLATEVMILDRIQKRAIRLVCQNFDSRASNSALQASRSWESLSERRDKARIYAMHKILSNQPAWLELKPFTTTLGKMSNRRGHQYKLGIKRFNTANGLHSLIGSGVRLWNELPLPYHLKLPERPSKFKLILEEFLKYS
jgi:hypothetical protein